MSLTRRRFVQAATLSLLARTTLPGALAEGRPVIEDPTFGPENLTALTDVSLKTFEPLIGETFTASSGHHSLGSLRLLSVSEVAPTNALATKPRMVGRVPQPSQQSLTGFTLRFQGSGAAMPQGTYLLRNASVGSIPLLLVPSHAGAGPATYTAVFNFLNSTGRT
jgi:hypothetical protein